MQQPVKLEHGRLKSGCIPARLTSICPCLLCATQVVSCADQIMYFKETPQFRKEVCVHDVSLYARGNALPARAVSRRAQTALHALA